MKSNLTIISLWMSGYEPDRKPSSMKAWRHRKRGQESGLDERNDRSCCCTDTGATSLEASRIDLSEAERKRLQLLLLLHGACSLVTMRTSPVFKTQAPPPPSKGNERRGTPFSGVSSPPFVPWH